MKINEKKFAIAEAQAHNEFWLSDELSVVSKVRAIILDRKGKVCASHELAYYTALICHETVRYEREVDKQLRKENRLAAKAKRKF